MRRGLTLLELMLAGGLMALLLTLTLSFLVPSLRASSRAALRVDLQQRANLAMEALSQDLQRCSASSIWLFPQGVCMQRLNSFTTGGMQLWEGSRVTYQWAAAGGPLVRETVAAESQPVAPSAADFQKWVTQKLGTEKLLAEPVSQFKVSWAGRVLGIDLELAHQNEHFELHRNLFLRNG